MLLQDYKSLFIAVFSFYSLNGIYHSLGGGYISFVFVDMYSAAHRY